MSAARRFPRIAPDHPFAHEPPEHPSAPAPDDHPSAPDPRDDAALPPQRAAGSDAAFLHDPSGAAGVPACSPCLLDASPLQGSGHSDEAGAPGECERAVYDPQARSFHDAEAGALLANEAAWERASEDQRAKARARLAAVRRAEELIALGIPHCEADPAAAKETAIDRGVLGR